MNNKKRKGSKTFLSRDKRIWKRCLEGKVDDSVLPVACEQWRCGC